MDRRFFLKTVLEGALLARWSVGHELAVAPKTPRRQVCRPFLLSKHSPYRRPGDSSKVYPPHARGFPKAPKKPSWEGFGEMTRTLVHFEAFPCRFVWRCHMLEHEDFEMMRPYAILGAPN